MPSPNDVTLLRTFTGNPLTLREILTYLAAHPSVYPGDPLDAPLLLEVPMTHRDGHRDVCSLSVTNDGLYGRTLLLSNSMSF
jgi:hypothetical protein